MYPIVLEFVEYNPSSARLAARSTKALQVDNARKLSSCPSSKIRLACEPAVRCPIVHCGA